MKLDTSNPINTAREPFDRKCPDTPKATNTTTEGTGKCSSGTSTKAEIKAMKSNIGINTTGTACDVIQKELEFSIETLSENYNSAPLKQQRSGVILENPAGEKILSLTSPDSKTRLVNESDYLYHILDKDAVESNFCTLTGQTLTDSTDLDNLQLASQTIMRKLGDQYTALNNVQRTEKHKYVAYRILELGITHANDVERFQEEVKTLLSNYS